MRLTKLTPAQLARRTTQKALLLAQSKLFSRRQPDRLDTLLARCDSPIEKLFLKSAYDTLSRLGKFDAQRSIGPYRPDFTLVGPGWRIIIQCDGHNYHSTEAQINADHSQDLEMAIAGWHVIRFTGSRIYRDAGGCVADVTRLVRAVTE